MVGMMFYLQLVTVLLASVIAFLQTIVFPGVADFLPIIRRPYLRVLKEFEQIYKIDKQFKTLDKSGKSNFGPDEFLSVDDAGFKEITEAIKTRIGSLANKEIIGIVESVKATNVDWHTGYIVPGNLAYAQVKDNDLTITFPFLKDPTENRILELWVFDTIRRKMERFIASVTLIVLIIWTAITIIALG